MRSDEERIAELHKKAGRLRAERARRRFRAAAAALPIWNGDIFIGSDFYLLNESDIRASIF